MIDLEKIEETFRQRKEDFDKVQDAKALIQIAGEVFIELVRRHLYLIRDPYFKEGEMAGLLGLLIQKINEHIPERLGGSLIFVPSSVDPWRGRVMFVYNPKGRYAPKKSV